MMYSTPEAQHMIQKACLPCCPFGCVQDASPLEFLGTGKLARLHQKSGTERKQKVI
jgi:hypothetical protein